jgi:hypothetical protein
MCVLGVRGRICMRVKGVGTDIYLYVRDVGTTCICVLGVW